jgi:hypothetical protein
MLDDSIGMLVRVIACTVDSRYNGSLGWTVASGMKRSAIRFSLYVGFGRLTASDPV